jgi:Zn-dependent protease
MVVQPDLARAAVFPFVLVGWLISLCLHEYGHAVAAYACGDHSVREKGYLTLDPLHYTNAQFSIIWPLVFLALGGIGLPGGAVYVNMGALRTPASRSLVSAAGPIATLLVLIVLLVVDATVPTAPYLHVALAFLAFLQLSALVLNLLPVPGLDGWGIIEPWLPYDIRDSGARLAPIGPTLLFMAFFLVPPVNAMFWRLVFDVAQITQLDARAAIQGLHLFQFWRY